MYHHRVAVGGTGGWLRYRAGRHRLNFGDCLHYVGAKYQGVPILATDDEFRQTDLETVP